MERQSPRKGVKVLAAGLTLNLAADTPYDRQLVVEHVSALLRRHGAVRLSVGRRAWWLTLARTGTTRECVHCGRALECAVELTGGDLACVPCASRRVVSDHVRIQRPAA